MNTKNEMTTQGENNAIVPSRQTPPPATLVTLTSYGSIEQMFKVAEFLARSPIVPQTFQGNPGSVLIALNMATRLNLDPFMVMQNIYVVHGTPTMSGKFAIALLNKSPKYARIEYRKTTNGGMLVVGHRHDGSVDEGTEINDAMISGEGWNKNPKWKTMRDQMLRYRAAAFFARAYCPEELMGLQTVEELQDIDQEEPRKASARVVAPSFLPTPGVSATDDDIPDLGIKLDPEVPSFGSFEH